MLIAVDIGNTRIKFGAFQLPLPTTGLPTPAQVLELTTADDPEFSHLLPWLNQPREPLTWVVASVNRTGLALFQSWLQQAIAQQRLPSSSLRLLTHQELGLVNKTEHPDRVGIDRLLGAVGANWLRPQHVGAVTIHLGSALTVNLIDPAGAFCGGAILPGIGMSARAMHEFTDLLPLIPMQELRDPPAAVGTATVSAMRAGLYWGAVGAMRELLAQMSQQLPAPPAVYLTGGAAASVASCLGPNAKLVPHLILGAIARLGAKAAS